MNSFGQGSIGFIGLSSGDGNEVQAENGLSVDPIRKTVVLGNDVGGTDATLFTNREIPGTLALTMPQGRFGVGLDADTLDGGAYVQNSVFQKDTFTNQNVQGTLFVRTTSTPTGNLLINTDVPASLQLVLDFTNGYMTGSGNALISVSKQVPIVVGNDGNKTTWPINGSCSQLFPQGVINISEYAGFRALSPDNSTIDPASVVDEISAFVAEDQSQLQLAGTTTYCFKSLGPADLVQLAGLPVRSSTGKAILRNDASGNLESVTGASGSFLTADAKTVTVVDGIITSIV